MHRGLHFTSSVNIHHWWPTSLPARASYVGLIDCSVGAPGEEGGPSVSGQDLLGRAYVLLQGGLPVGAGPTSDRSRLSPSASQLLSLSPPPSAPGEKPTGFPSGLRMYSLRLLQSLPLSFFFPGSGNHGPFASFRILSEFLAPAVAGPGPDRSS